MSFEEFWTERHLCTLTTLRADGTPHVVPVGVTLDGDVARVITSSTSQKVRNVRNGGSRVAVCQVDGARWSTLEGVATVHDDPEAVARAVRLYSARYREPRANPLRVVIEIKITRELGNVRRD
ncbi:PPOX class F420-dependent oxidoreductase [Herbidospora galbida]|uniref:PPOX class F420-dependent oxidoreductase n=1 Tax=Herbidospora galbida TaxID=2575442 RepID=A0A4U3LSM0_9ACTN|nr:PPOX class F420-dependent oxidoreductase [Herbidospora galbida]TKK78770.1 PPOX class F420-dependent oxidoreductase [Herbidospora galbida]